MKKYQNFCLLCLLPLFLFGCKEDKKEPQQTVDNTVVEAKKEDKKLLYIKCSQFENKKCSGIHEIEKACVTEDEKGVKYMQVEGSWFGMKDNENAKIYNYADGGLWYFDPPTNCDDKERMKYKNACKPMIGNCYVYLGSGIVEMQGYDIMGSLFGRINAAFGDLDKDRLVTFFPNSKGDIVYHTYINDRFKEYKETVVTLFNTIKFGIVLAKNADEFKEYINKAADRFDEYYKLETDDYTYGLYQDKEKIKQLYENELKRIAKVRKDLLEIVDVYKDALFMTEEQLSQNKIRRLAGFAEINPEDDDCGRYSL